MERKRFIKKYIAIFVISIIAIIIASVTIKYSVEGESNLPFEISKVMVISTAEGSENGKSDYKWDLNLLQRNDTYIDIIKNKNYKEEEIIDKVIINNIKIAKSPEKGKVTLYRPNNTKIFNNSEEYKIENEIIFVGAEASNLENLQLANQGGLILLRCVNENIGTYTSNDDTEIRHDGTLLTKIGVTDSQISFDISFDVSIELKSGKKFKTTLLLEMPIGDIITEGTTNYQLGRDKIVFKRY